MNRFFTSGGLSIGVSASTSVLPMNIQDWFPSGWTGWVSLQSKGFSSLLQHHSSKAPILQHSAFFIVQLSHPYMTTGKTIALTRQTFVATIMSLLFNMLSRLIITFFQGASVFWFHGCSHHLQWFWSPRKHCFYYFPIYLQWSDGTGCHDLCFWMLSFRPAFSLSSFTFIKRLFSSSLSAIRVVSYTQKELHI